VAYLFGPRESLNATRPLPTFSISSDINDAPFPIPEDILNNKDHHYLSLLV